MRKPNRDAIPLHLRLPSVTVEDLSKLQHISRQTFEETFAAGNTRENMNKYLEEGFSSEKLSAELSNPDTEFYFAEHNGQAIGYLKLNFRSAQTELKEDNGVEIERIYVAKNYHGHQVGQALYDKAIERAKQKRAAYVWLGVWEENPRAIRFYQKNGFVEFGKHAFTLGDDVQTDLMMKLELSYP